MTAWTDLVKKVWNENKATPGFKFKDALIKAKAQYKSTSSALNKTAKKIKSKILGRKNGGNTLPKMGGDKEDKDKAEGEDEKKGGDMPALSPASVTGGKRRTKKDRKDDKKEEKEEKKGGDSKIGSTDKGTPYFDEKK